MRVLVTGAYGFVGNAVVRELARAGHEVHALTRGSGAGGLSELPVARVWRGDLRDAAALRPALEGVKGVCHLAALTGVREVVGADDYSAVNVRGTETLLDVLAESARASGTVPAVVLASSAAVYGPAAEPITEGVPPEPASPYGRSKAEAEAVLRERVDRGGVAGVALRCFNISGAVAGVGDRDESRIIPKTLAVAAGRAAQLTMNGDGTAVRDFVHVGDVAVAFRLALESTAGERYRCYNVGATGAGMGEIVALAREVTGRPIPVTMRRPPLPEIPVSLADTTRIRAELGWLPKRSSLRELLADAWNAAGC
ncbi:NAD-dependent epimerase/dehydratase family protein [Streptacidiphilus sp. N1-3]|uniref:UDP-glucose 4-epimerase n=1 Tax=Streptacidiphilus alkalitolerans TaxID=3342712 RepID=A0ABV6X638_9ACTN